MNVGMSNVRILDDGLLLTVLCTCLSWYANEGEKKGFNLWVIVVRGVVLKAAAAASAVAAAAAVAAVAAAAAVVNT